MKGVLILFFVCICKSLSAQLADVDSIYVQKSRDNLKAYYFKNIGEQAGLYNGPKYAEYAFNFMDGGHPFFQSQYPSNGTVVYDKLEYQNVDLLYDEISDLLIFVKGTRYVQLHNERVSHFSIGENTFENLNGLKSGYYQLLSSGKIKVYKKEIKSIIEEIISPREGVRRFIKIETQYYCKKNNEFYNVKNSKELAKIYEDKKTEMSAFIKAKMLNFKKDKEFFLKETVRYYNQISQ